ncbi:hypothetical protein BH10ACI3_BH10ACI3_27620 [soil metagenome]
MMNAEKISEIIATYEKHGWVLRRVLLSAVLKSDVGSELFNGVQIVESDFNAAWFSRPPQPGGVAWEIRYLGDVAFAFVENIDEYSGEFEDDLRRVEMRLRDTVASKRSA